ncbi:MAG TPA: ATP-binding protein, partial [Flavisolibacter sp.]|nr:ATP-binding protein [Flavisolibacter sp.]
KQDIIGLNKGIESPLQDNLSCIITIKDNGTGFEEINTDKLFTLFKSLHDRTNYNGNGIGLVIVKKIMEAHGGSIKVKSQPGAGSSFIITIPLKQKNSPFE